jgi:hypothetical protein
MLEKWPSHGVKTALPGNFLLVFQGFGDTPFRFLANILKKISFFLK